MNNNTPAKSAEFMRSSFYEKLVEHVFVSEVLQETWFRHHKSVEVLRSEVDDSGYDLVLECGSTIRHVQLKSSAAASRTGSQKINIGLAAKPSGCVVWIIRHEDPATARVRLDYGFFGGKPDQPLPSLENFKVARHTKADSTGVKSLRANVRVVPKSCFEKLPDIAELVERLFGDSLRGE